MSEERSVEVKQLCGRNIATGINQYYELWMIYVCDGEDRWLAGRLDWTDGAEIAYLKPIDPFTRKWIDEEVSKEVGRDVDSNELKDVTDILAELERDSLNELNEEDLTG